MKENKEHLENNATEKVTGGEFDFDYPFPFPFKEKKCRKCGSTDLSEMPETLGDIFICNKCGAKVQIW